MPRLVPVLVAVAIIIIVVGAALYFVFLSGNRASPSSNPSQQFIMSLALEHWAAIGEKNVTLLMSQYSVGYEASWFFINDSSVGPTNGRYDCNIPRGVNNCSYFPSSAWETLFNKTGTWNYTICSANVTNELDGREVVQAIVWYFLTNRNETLKVPYEMDLQYFNGTWAVWKDWFGLEQEQASISQGIKVVTCTQ
ncbi:MAG: hypothetical protein ACYC7D_09025 [Nitrososphaerales archaeon]